PSLLAAGSFPITSIGGASIQVRGDLFAGHVSGTLLFGVVRFDSNGKVVDGLGFLQGTTTPGVAPFTSAFYGAIAASFDIAGTWDLEMRMGLSAFGPLDISVEAGVPIPLGPTSLFLSVFRGGIEFGRTFPTPTISTPPAPSDALVLRKPAFTTPDKLTASQ